MTAATGSKLPRLLLVLLAIVSLGTTVLVTLNVMAGRARQEEMTRTRQAVTDPPVISALPPFALTSHTGQPVTLDRLSGKVWVAGFIFTRCSGPCPAMTSRMAQIQRDLGPSIGSGQVRLVSFTVDPVHDTPSVLRGYATLARAGDGWLFLTGDRGELWDLTKEGFKLPVFENAKDPAMPIAHSQKFVLIDQQGRIRGYYDALEAEGYRALINDMKRVLKE